MGDLIPIVAPANRDRRVTDEPEMAAILKGVTDWLHYFHGIDLEERDQRKLAHDWIAPNLNDLRAGR